MSLVINNTPGQIGGPKVGNERPQHRVTLCRPFALGRYAVTFDDYDAVRAATGRQKPGDRDWGRGRRPVINVSPPRRSGSTPAGPGNAPATRAVTTPRTCSPPPTPSTPIARPTGPGGSASPCPAETASPSPPLSAASHPMPSASTTCTATPGSGSRTGTPGMRTPTRPRRTPKAPRKEASGCAAAGPGTPGLSMHAAPTATGTTLRPATPWWECAWRWMPGQYQARRSSSGEQ